MIAFILLVINKLIFTFPHCSGFCFIVTSFWLNRIEWSFFCNFSHLIYKWLINAHLVIAGFTGGCQTGFGRRTVTRRRRFFIYGEWFLWRENHVPRHEGGKRNFYTWMLIDLIINSWILTQVFQFTEVYFIYWRKLP